MYVLWYTGFSTSTFITSLLVNMSLFVRHSRIYYWWCMLYFLVWLLWKLFHVCWGLSLGPSSTDIVPHDKWWNTFSRSSNCSLSKHLFLIWIILNLFLMICHKSYESIWWVNLSTFLSGCNLEFKVSIHKIYRQPFWNIFLSMEWSQWGRKMTSNIKMCYVGAAFNDE